jgi:hypothetical protein
VHEKDCDVELALDGAERTEDRGDIGGRILIDAADETDEGIED